jgi:hypothetical protein
VGIYSAARARDLVRVRVLDLETARKAVRVLDLDPEPATGWRVPVLVADGVLVLEREPEDARVVPAEAEPVLVVDAVAVRDREEVSERERVADGATGTRTHPSCSTKAVSVKQLASKDAAPKAVQAAGTVPLMKLSETSKALPQ